MTQKEKGTDKDNKDHGIWIIGSVVALLIIGLWITTYFLLVNNEEKGPIGDMFGSVNALFSGLALAGIILTILLQRKELQLQRIELRDTRREFETQNATLKIQRFENTFFNLLNLHNQIVDAIDYTNKKNISKRLGISEYVDEIIQSRDVFQFRYNSMVRELQESPSAYEEIYLRKYIEAQTDFGHYFRNLYRMIKLVDETDFFYDSTKVSPDEIFEIKYRYTSIIRSQLSDYELLWLYYNCLSKNGREKFKPLIERYTLFKNIPKELIAHESHIEMYDKMAFVRGDCGKTCTTAVDNIEEIE